jgi:hypothetical protein
MDSQISTPGVGGEVQTETKRKGAPLDAMVLRWDGRRGLSRDDQTLHSRKSGQVVRTGAGRFHPTPWNGVGLPAPSLKGQHRKTVPAVRAGGWHCLFYASLLLLAIAAPHHYNERKHEYLILQR